MFRKFAALALTMGLATSAMAIDGAYYQVKSVKVSDVTNQYSSVPFTDVKNGLNQDCDASNGLGTVQKFSTNPLDDLNIVLDQIVNIGKKIFDVIASGRPVVNERLDVANALPRGLTCWSDLAGWNAPQAKVYRVQYENYLGMQVVDFTYRVTYTAGGNANGIGKYITNATVMPANISVAWGWKLDANAAIPSVFNTGTKSSPVAGMQMNVDWKVTNAVSYEHGTESYYVSGENTMTQL